MKGILVDPFTKSVEEIKSEGDFPLEELHKLIGAETLDFAHPFGWKETVVVDDDGIAKNLASFRIEDCSWPIYGRAVILGRDSGGGTRSTGFTVEEVYEKIAFLK
jgi:hypothetical protein